MEEIISKKELNELMKIEGETRGAGIKDVLRFILKEKGEEGLKKLEDAMAKLDYPIKFKRIKTIEFYPLAWYTVIQLVAKRLFNFDDKKLEEMGRFNAKFSLIFRFLMKHLLLLKRAAKEVPKMWRRYYTIGDLKTIEYDEEKKYVILRLENFRVHSLFCQIFKGYFPAVLEIIVRSKVTCEETKCPFRGDEYHEFLLRW